MSQQTRRVQIFVYGTLRGHEHSIGEATMHGVELDDTGNYPTVVPDGESSVEGELLDVPDDMLVDFDRVEQEGTLYDRIEYAPGSFVYVGYPDLIGAETWDRVMSTDELAEYFEESVTVVR